jgi:hypothetical protein
MRRRTMRDLFAILVFLTVGLAPAVALACLMTPGGRGQNCAFASDCQGRLQCFQSVCLSPEQIARLQQGEWDDSEQMLQARPTPAPAPAPPPEPEPLAASPLDDGGADAACGADRRCRIERLKARNRHRRHLEIAEQEQAVYRQVERLQTRRVEEVHRLARPWMLGGQVHPTGLGFIGSRTLHTHFRVEATWVRDFFDISYFPEDAQLPSVEGSHAVSYGFIHGTFLPSRAWFSPFLSAGVGYGRGHLRPRGMTTRPGETGGPADLQVIYHLLTAAVGAEAQADFGGLIRLGFRHGFVIYNQARYGPGSYDIPLRGSLGEYMQRRGLMGVDFTLGWAF